MLGGRGKKVWEGGRKKFGRDVENSLGGMVKIVWEEG